MYRKMLSLVAFAALVAMPLAYAHNSFPNVTTDVSPNLGCWATQNPHDYDVSGSIAVTGRSTTTGDVGQGVGITSVQDSNTQDCDGDMVPGDFDGDLEYGNGGAFLPTGVWAEHECNGYLNHHSMTVTVTDATPGTGAVFPDTSFSVGADPTVNIVSETDPVTGEQITVCISDGAITPGDEDPDDWLDSCINTCTGSGAAGFDGGIWVFVNTDIVVDADTGQPSGYFSLRGHISTA